MRRFWGILKIMVKPSPPLLFDLVDESRHPKFMDVGKTHAPTLSRRRGIMSAKKAAWGELPGARQL